ncbi:TPA: EexN family lipoprotein, partial [Escherichia coli]|nr:EexN family lipoprotein [Escherichia coli]
EDIKTVDWWRNHPEEAISKVEECKKSGDVSDNCKNAKTALYKNQQQDAPVPQIN